MTAALGLIVGSFLNVCIWRMPRGASVVAPSSRCPACGTPIRPWDNLPVLSFLVLGGRCRHCRARISARYPIVEALNAALYVLVLWRYGLGYYLPVYLAFASSLIVITFIDLDFQIIPDRITIPWIPLGLLSGSFLLPDPFSRGMPLGLVNSIAGASSGFLLFYAVAALSRGGMGGGDIKMMAMVGAVLGWKGALLTTFLASLLGSAAGIALMVFKGKGRKAKVPFGPFLAAGSLLCLVAGEEMLGWYLGFGR